MIDRIQRLDRIFAFIKRKGTGAPGDFAKRLGISERTLYNDLDILKQFGADISYCAEHNSLVLHNKVELQFSPVVKNEKNISGGKSIFFRPLQNFCREGVHLWGIDTKLMQFHNHDYYVHRSNQ